MDGAEKLLEGVYILAATSRPDLIDPALLRPGRLDKSLLCDMPSKSDRREIITIFAEEFNIDKSLDLNEIADKCENFNGADLQALLYNAYLEAIHQNRKYEDQFIVKKDVGEEHDKIKVHNLANLENNKDSFVEYVKVIENNLFNKIISKGETIKNDQNIIINTSHINKALKTTKSSLNQTELNRLKKIYEEFSKGKDIPTNIGNKSTLA